MDVAGRGHVPDMITGTDLFVTLARIAGAQVPPDRPIDGMDISPVLRGQPLPERDMFWALPSISNIEYVIRRSPWKMLLGADWQPLELYNLAQDPLELFNLLQERPQIQDQLMRSFTHIVESIDTDPVQASLQPPGRTPLRMKSENKRSQ